MVALFHVLEKEKEWRKAQGLPLGFTTAETYKPIVAVGASHPLEDELLMADFFRMCMRHFVICLETDRQCRRKRRIGRRT